MNQNAVRPQCFAAVGDELDRAGADIADSLGGLDGGGAHLRAEVRRHARRRRFLDHLLVAALQRTIALAEMDDVAVRVGKDLKLHVARRGDVFLDQDPTGAEGRGNFAHCSFERIVEVGVLVDAPQPASAAARCRLDQHRVADLIRLLFQEFRVLPFPVIAGHDRDARLLHQRLGAILEPHGADRGGRRPHENEVGLRTGFREIGVLRQKPVARVNALGTAVPRGLDQPFDREIAFARLCRTDAMRLIAQPHMQGARVGGRVDGDGAHAKSFGGTSDTAGDLAAIGDEDRAEHEARILEHDGAPPSLVFREDFSRGEARDSVRRSTGAAGAPQAECGRIGPSAGAA